MARPFDLVLFDLDGTLVDTAPDIADAVNDVLVARGCSRLPERWVRDRIGFGTRALLLEAHAAARRWPPAAGEPDNLGAELTEAFAARYADRCGRRGRPYPGAAATLAGLRRAGARLALLTNKERRFAQLLLEVHGLDGEFDLRVYGDSLPAKKPDPLPVRHCLEVLQVAAARALLVGDSAIDVETARNAGIAVWAVDYGYNGGAPVAAARPDRLLAALVQLLGAFAVVPGGPPAAPELLRIL